MQGSVVSLRDGTARPLGLQTGLVCPMGTKLSLLWPLRLKAGQYAIVKVQFTFNIL